MNAFCGNTVSVCCTCFHSSAVTVGTLQSTGLLQGYIIRQLQAIALTSLQVFPTIVASSSIVLLHLTLIFLPLHVSYPYAIVIFCATSVAFNNTVHKIWKCAASAATSLGGLNELTCISYHVCIDMKVFRNCVKAY